MDAKFKRIADFLETLSTQNVLGADEEALFLVGGTGAGPATNNGCINDSCTAGSDRTDNGCTNNSCSNSRC
ncbi:hypothetical protein [uncultured Phocaeicola sp.]|uniref:hypothetical protein n=1 Tax=uncultured Phocaeicola sp. TaxID=990718 RepID=UPI000E88581A|nr:hypothetical protein [uncultured Phocaeicola sp.]GFI01001.1 hypothetical protein IMSAGC004_03412 [Bacteroidaceae bacterium]HBV84332.1 hypothetical protein [Lachnospiraceae bacterium]